MKSQDSIGHLENEIHFHRFGGATRSRALAKRLLESTCS
jgi:hypothetical protein